MNFERCGLEVVKTITTDKGITVTVKIDKKQLKTWAKIFRLKGYRKTEFAFPRKKKRGTMRRRRAFRRWLKRFEERQKTIVINDEISWGMFEEAGRNNDEEA